MAGKDRDLRSALARAIADRKCDPEVVQALADRLTSLEYRVRGINPCIYGICLDYFVEKPEFDDLIAKSLEIGRIRELKVFPWGIPWPDLFHVQIEHQFEGIPDAGIVMEH